MSENRNRSNETYANYDSMTDEELEELLRLDAGAPEGDELDAETLLYIMGLLADRRKNSNITGKTAQESFESFKRNYLNEDEHIVSTPAKKKVTPSMRWLRRLTAVAAVLAVILLGSVTIKASGITLWEAVVTWAQETFHFGSGEQGEPAGDRKLQHTSLQEAIAIMEKKTDLVPTWIPEGYELTEIHVAENPMRRKYVAVYQIGEKYLKITVQSYLNGYPEQIEQSEGYADIIAINEVKYYIAENNNLIRVAWINGSYECYISGELTVEQLTKMINSIEEG